MNRHHHPSVAALMALLVFLAGASAGAFSTDKRPVTILCTTFPIYQITRNVTGGNGAVAVGLMLAAESGCPHDYALTPRDMIRLSEADIVIRNGLGMEAFLDRALASANPNAVVIDSAQGVDGVLDDAEHPDESHDHGHGGVNPHLFSGPRMNANLAENIAAGLAAVLPDEAAAFTENARRYAERLRALAGEMAAVVAAFRNRRIVEPHGAFDYLARDVGLEIAAHMRPHGEEASAARLLELLAVIGETRPAAIVVEAGSGDRLGETVAAETGLPLVRLDSGAAGPADAPTDYYETVMRANLAALADALGGGRP